MLLSVSQQNQSCFKWLFFNSLFQCAIFRLSSTFFHTSLLSSHFSSILVCSQLDSALRASISLYGVRHISWTIISASQMHLRAVLIVHAAYSDWLRISVHAADGYLACIYLFQGPVFFSHDQLSRIVNPNGMSLIILFLTNDEHIPVAVD